MKKLTLEDMAVADLERLGRGLAAKKSNHTSRSPRTRQAKIIVTPRSVDEPTHFSPVLSGACEAASRTATTPQDDAPLIPATSRDPGANMGLAIVCDTRERVPFTFDRFQDVAEVRRGTLKTGDYSLAGHEDAVAIERKELGDLIGCLTRDRARFERELARGREMILAGGCFSVVAECSWEDIARGRYHSRMSPESALQSVLAFSIRYRVPFILAGSRRAAEYMTHGLLRQFAREIQKREKEHGYGQRQGDAHARC